MLRRSVLTSGAVLVAIVSLVSAQERRGQGRGDPGGMQGSIAMLLGMAEVQKELGLNDDQKKQVDDLSRELREQMRSSSANLNIQQTQDLSPEEREKRIAESRKKAEAINQQAEAKLVKIFDAKQVQRFDQLRVQREGLGALGRPDVAARLGLTEDQQAKIRELQESVRPQMRSGPSQSREDPRASLTRALQQREKMQADVLAVLTDAQKAKWTELKGKEFTFPQGGVSGFGRGGERVRPPVKKRDQ